MPAAFNSRRPRRKWPTWTGPIGESNQIQAQNLYLDAVGLDFYDLAENVRKGRRAVFGEDDPAGHDWAGRLMHLVKHQVHEPFWERLIAWRGSLRSRSKRRAVDQLLHYVAHRREMIRYPEFQRRGWQIGSGPTESLCKTTTARVKGFGRRWDADNAEAIMSPAALDQSGQWSLYWQTRLPTTP